MSTLLNLKYILSKILEKEMTELEHIQENTTIESLHFDSITFLVVGIAIEEAFKVQITTEDLNRAVNVGDLIAIIERKQK